MELCKDKLAEIDDIQEYNQQKMIKAFQLADVRESHLWGSTGYGYDDAGREALDKVYAYVFDAEDALVRHNFVSGTHALTVALFGVLRPGLARNPRQLPLGHRPRWYRAAVASASSQAPADDRSGAARFP